MTEPIASRATERPPRLCLLVLNDVVNDGRVQRSAGAAAAHGFEVLVIGVRSSRAPDAERINGVPVVRIAPGGAVLSREQIARLEARPKPVVAPAHGEGHIVPSAGEAARSPGRWKQFQKAYDEAVTFPLRRNRLYQTLNTYDKRLRRALKRMRSGDVFGPMPPALDGLARRLADVSVWEQSRRHMGDHDAIVHDQVHLGQSFAAQALAFEPDIVHCNDLDTLLAGLRIKQARGGRCALIYDAHELWTEQHAPRRAREERTEAYYAFYDDLLVAMAPLIDGAITVNPTIAAVLESRCPPLSVEVVLNCPRRVDGALRRDGPLRQLAQDRVVVLMHGGLIAADRGLAELMAAAPLLERALLVFRGNGSMRPELERTAQALGLLGTHVVFEDLVALDAVIEAGAEADIGVIPYKPTGINNLLCSPNKLFEYMMSGLAVAASDLPELRRVISGNDAGVLFNPNRPASIAAAINALTHDRERLEVCRANARRAALDRYCWEAQSSVLLDVYTRALSAVGRLPAS